jgi:hypothetical protein
MMQKHTITDYKNTHKKEGALCHNPPPNTPPKHMNINLVGTQSIWAGTEQNQTETSTSSPDPHILNHTNNEKHLALS